MSLAASKIMDQGLYEDQKSSKLEGAHLRVVTERATQIRDEIGRIADHSFHAGVIKLEAYENYKKLANWSEEHAITDKMLESTLEFAQAYDKRAIPIYKKMLKAKNEKIASDTDEKFLMKFVFDNFDFVDQANEIEVAFEQKIENLKRDKKRYEKLSKNPFLQNEAILRVQAKGKIKLNNLKSYLEATVPERREFMDAIADAISNEEIKAAYEKKDKASMLTAYLSKLNRQVSTKPGQGSIGRYTFNVIKKKVSKLDLNGIKEWNDKFEEKIAERSDFCKEFRSTLRGAALAQMEANLQKMGFPDQQDSFKEIKKAESQRLCQDYKAALGKYRGAIIGKHTESEFNSWMANLPLQAQYDAESRLEDWEAMGKYRRLWFDIGTLDKDQQMEMRSKLDEWGYSEFEKQLNEYLGLKDVESNMVEKGTNYIHNSSIRNSIDEIDEQLVKIGNQAQADQLITMLKKQETMVVKHEFEEVVEEAANTQEYSSKNKPDEESNESENESTLDENLEEAEANGAQVTQVGSYQKVETETKKARHAVIDRQRDLRKLLGEADSTDQKALTTTISVRDSNNNVVGVSGYVAGQMARELKARQEARKKYMEKDFELAA